MKNVIKKFVDVNIKRLNILIIFLLLIGIVIILKLNFYNKEIKRNFTESENIIYDINDIQSREYKLNYLILKSTFYLYENNDKVMQEINNIKKLIVKLKENKFFKRNFPLSYRAFLRYEKFFKKKENTIYRFYIFNSMIKNATIYLDKILINSVNVFKNEPKFLEHEMKSISNIFIVKNSFDKLFLNNLDISYFKDVNFKDYEKEKLKNVLIANLLLFKNNFPEYSKFLYKIQHSASIYILKSIYDVFMNERKEKIEELNFTFNFIIFMLAGGIVIVSLLLFLVNKEHKDLQEAFVTDKLTGLGNREKLNQDLKNYKHPILYLINIDKFKHFNDIYGNEIGDAILKKVALILKNNFECKNKNVYRLGSDDFAIVCEGDLKYKKIINYFENHPIILDGKQFNIRVSIGISDEYPLVENADMALKKVKSDSKIKCYKFTKNSSIKKEYEENLKKSRFLENAIKHDLIVPVFQPIVYNHFYRNENNKTCKYEVLARIKDNRELKSVYPYLKIAKENKIYKEITKSVFKKAYEIFKNNNLEFSLNLSIDDILENETMDLINKLTEDKDFAKRCTFELLESEAIEDYDIVEKFISKMKKRGVKFAIDDFGSGYSNFEHIINLHIDYLKIDGSLIKKIDFDKNSRIIVETINSFAQRIGLITIAEFVCNENVYKCVKQIGIECSQGYYFYPPLEKIL